MHGFPACKVQSGALVWTSAKCSSFHCEGGRAAAASRLRWAWPGQVTSPQSGGLFPPALKGQGVGGSHQSLEKLPVFDKAVKTAFSPPTLFLVLEDE